MAKKKEIDEFLKESGYSRKDLEDFFNEAKEVNWIIQKFSEDGKKWSDLPIYHIEQLPGLKERTLENIKKHEEEKAKDKKEKEDAKKQKKYYEENFEKIMHEKILAKSELTEKELSRLVFEYEVESEQVDELRWTYLTETIVELCGERFKIKWQRAKTEMQEHVFMDQPVLV